MKRTNWMIGTVVTVWLAQPTGTPPRLLPVRGCPRNSRTRIESRSLDDFQLPPKSIFDRSMPRYPNAWFYVEPSLAPSYEAALKLVTGGLAGHASARVLRAVPDPGRLRLRGHASSTCSHGRGAPRARSSMPMRSTCATTTRRSSAAGDPVEIARR